MEHKIHDEQHQHLFTYGLMCFVRYSDMKGFSSSSSIASLNEGGKF